MRTAVRAVAGAALAAASLCAGAAHATTTGQVVTTGPGGSVATFRIAAPVTVSGFSATTRGHYAGYRLDRVKDGRLLRYAVRLSRSGFTVDHLVAGSTAALAAGTYRITIVSDAPATVTLAEHGLGGVLRLAAHGTGTTRGGYAALAGTPSAASVALTVPGTYRAALLMSEASYTGGGARYQTQCVTTQPRCPAGPGSLSDVSVDAAAGTMTVVRTTEYDPGELPAGAAAARFELLPAGSTSYAGGLAVILA